MSWTQGTWADVAIGDTVLGGDGYPWGVTDGLINHFGVSGKGESLRVTMKREPIGARTGDLLASKPTKYQAGEPRGVVISCNDCQYAGKPSCELHAPEPKDAEREAWIQREAEETGEPIESVRALVDEVDPREQVFAEIQAARAGVKEAERESALAELANGTPVVAPYVEYDAEDRAAAAALKGAGLTMTVIERVMTLDGLTEHIGNVHGEPLPGAGGNLTRIELRSKLADMHFELHAADQDRGRKWTPRGRTAHTHPVMDRPMDDAEPKSLRSR